MRTGVGIIRFIFPEGSVVFMKRFLCIIVAAVLMICSASIALAEAPVEKQPLKIGLLMPAMTHGWVSGITYYAKKKADKLAAEGKIEYKLSVSSNAEEMTSQIDEMILWGAKALIVAPQWKGMEVPIQNAINQGIIVIAFDMDIDADGIYKVTGDNKSMGVEGAKYLVDKIGKEGTVVALPVPTAGSVNDLRMQGFHETMTQIAPNMKILEYSVESFAKEDGLKVMADVLTKNPKIDAVFSLDDETSMGALQAMQEAGRNDIKLITGGGGCQEYFRIIKDTKNMIACTTLYSPKMVEECFEIALKLHSGEKLDNHVIVIPTKVVDAGNADEYIDPNNSVY